VKKYHESSNTMTPRHQENEQEFGEQKTGCKSYPATAANRRT
jgi:hypothetical protein